MEQAVTTALPYIKAYLRPQVLITQGELLEDLFFTRGIRESQNIGIPHIALPRTARELMWMATLDSHALRSKYRSALYYIPYAKKFKNRLE
jgi:26S proteasome regulatory subunit N1